MVQWNASRRVIGRVLFGIILAITGIGLSLTSYGARAQTAQQIAIKNFSFQPNSVTVAPGTTVTWTNQDSVGHTSTSDQGSPVSWDSGVINPGQSFSMTFTQPGTYTYHCNIHPQMQGTIIVQSASGAGSTSTPTATPTVTPTATPSPTAAPAQPSPIRRKVVKAKQAGNTYIFDQKKITVKVRTRVVWKNISNAAHTVTSSTKSWKFDKMLNPGKSVSYVFKKAGTYHYFCKFHPGMVGTIVVKK